MIDKLKSLGRDSLVYGLGAVLAKSLAFFLLPVYTAHFSTGAYGRLDLVSTMITLLGSVAMLGLDSANSFFFMEQKNSGSDAQARAVTAILQLLLPSSLLVAAAGMIGCLVVNQATVSFVSPEVIVFAAGNIVALNLSALTAGLFRLLYRPWTYLLLTLGASMVSAGTGLWLILKRDWGISGFFAGNLAGSLIAAFTGLWLIRSWLRPAMTLQREWFRRILRFSLPVMPMGLAMWLMHSMDRWFLAAFRPDSDLGLYAVGAKFAILIGLAVNVFRDAWWPHALEAMHSADGTGLFRVIGRAYVGLGSAGLVLLGGLSPHLLRVMAAPAYHNAWPMVSVLAAAAVCYGGYLVFSPGIWKLERSGVGLLLLLGAVGVNAFLCRLLVPSFGITGAAVATATAFLSWLASACFVSEKLWSVGFPGVRLTVQAAAAALGIAAVIQIHHFDTSGWSGLGAGVIFAALLLAGAMSPAEWRRALAVFDNRPRHQVA